MHDAARSRRHFARVLRRRLRWLPGVRAPCSRAALALLAAVELLVILALLRSRSAAFDGAVGGAVRVEEDVDVMFERAGHGLPGAVVDPGARVAISEGGERFGARLRAFLGLGVCASCEPLPCERDHWEYVGNKCYYTGHVTKDRATHNASVWNLVENGWYYTPTNDFACPAPVCRHQWPSELNATREVLKRALHEHFKEETPWNFEAMYTGSQYVRENALWGLEYTLNGYLSLTDSNGRNENRTASVVVRRGFTHKYCEVQVHTDVLPTHQPVYIVVPYAGRLQQLRLFYENIHELIAADVALRVVVAVHGGPEHILGAIELLRELRLGLTEGDFADGHLVRVVPVAGDRRGLFSRSRALLDGTRVVPLDGLVFYCDVDMIVQASFFDNCRYNVIRGHQVYYPIVYSLYPYGYKVSREHGYWRSGAFGMVCGYKSDFERTSVWRRSNAAGMLTGWGFEDVMLYKELSNHWQISVFRAVEPGLLHRWHPKFCEFNSHVAACLGTIFQNMGSQRFLAAIVANHGIDVRDVPYDPAPTTFSDYKNDTAGSPQRLMEIPAAESETDGSKLREFEKIYNEAIRVGKGGMLSVFAKEAQEAMMRVNLQQVEHASAPGHVPLDPIRQPTSSLGDVPANQPPYPQSETGRATSLFDSIRHPSAVHGAPSANQPAQLQPMTQGGTEDRDAPVPLAPEDPAAQAPLAPEDPAAPAPLALEDPAAPAPLALEDPAAAAPLA